MRITKKSSILAAVLALLGCLGLAVLLAGHRWRAAARNNSAELNLCRECSDAELKELLLKEVEGLAPALAEGEKLRAAELLLGWASHVIDWTSNVNERPNLPLRNAQEMSASQIYDVYLKDDGGGLCAAAAIFMAKVLALFDLPVLAVNGGLDLESLLTHVTTILALKGPSGYKFYIFDPYTNGTFFDREGGYADLATLFKNHDQASHLLGSGLEFRYETCVPRDIIINTHDGVLLARKAQPHCLKTDLARFEEYTRSLNKTALADLMVFYQAEPRGNLILDMLRHEIYGIYGAPPRLRKETVKAFCLLMKESGYVHPCPPGPSGMDRLRAKLTNLWNRLFF